MPRKSPRGAKIGRTKKRVRKVVFKTLLDDRLVDSSSAIHCENNSDVRDNNSSDAHSDNSSNVQQNDEQCHVYAIPADGALTLHDHPYAIKINQDVGDFFSPDDDDSACAEMAQMDELPEEHYLILPGKIFTCDSDGNIPGFDWFSYLKDSISKNSSVVHKFGFSIANTTETIQIMKVYDTHFSGIKVAFVIDEKMDVHYIVHNKKVPIGCSVVLPKHVNTLLDVHDILEVLSKCDICEGNYDTEFNNLYKHRENMSAKSHDLLCYKEGFCGASYSSTVRSSTCHLLYSKFKSTSKRCPRCIVYRNTLRKFKNINIAYKARVVPIKQKRTHKKPHSAMTNSEMAEKFKSEKHHRIKIESELKSTKSLVAKLIDQQGEQLNVSDNDDIMAMTVEFDKKMKEKFHKNSFEYVFWTQQSKFNRLKAKSGMRWHPLIIKWCLQLQHISSKTYNALANSGFIHLPSERTLFDYSHVLPSKSGFKPEIIADLIKEATAKGMYSVKEGEEWKSFVGILQDEIKIKQDLVYDKTTGELIGYIDLDKTGNVMSEFNRLNKEAEQSLAKFMLVVMVRGANSDLKYPLASFATDGITSGLLYPIIWQAIEILEVDCNLKVIFITCDGASPNRKFFQLHRTHDGQLVYYTDNPFSADDRKIYFVADVPHLIKTTRNCFANSYAHKKTRKLWINGKDIRWTHIVRLYEEHIEYSLYSRNYKITRDHIDLTAFNQMKVRLAAQILSSSVADALESEYGDPCSETVKFIRHMNRFFDCLNVRCLGEGHRKRLD